MADIDIYKKIYRKCEFTIELRQNILQFNNRLLLTNIFSVKYNFFIGNPMKFFSSNAISHMILIIKKGGF